MIKKIFIPLIIGLILSLAIFLHEPRLHNWLEETIQRSFSQSFDCSMHGRLSKFSFLFPLLCIENMHVSSLKGDEEWQWHCKRFTIRTNWWDLLIKKTVNLTIDLEDVVVDSCLINNRLAIEAHIKKMLEDTPLPVKILLSSVAIHNGSFLAHDDEKNKKFLCSWNIHLKQHTNDTLSLNGKIHNAAVCSADHYLLKDVEGTLSASIAPNNSINAQAHLSYFLPWLTDQKCSLCASCLDNNATCTLFNENNSLLFDDITLRKKDDQWLFSGQAICSLSSAEILCLPQSLSALCRIAMSGHMDGTMIPKFEGSIIINDLSYKDNSLCSEAELALQGNCLSCVGQLKVATQQGTFKGDMHLDYEKSAAHIVLKNATTLNLGNAIIPQEKGVLECNLFDWNALDGFLTIAAHDNKDSLVFAIQGEAHGPDFHIQMPFSNIKSLLKHTCNFDLQGQGSINFKGNYGQQKIKGFFYTEESLIRLPGTYNFMKEYKSLVSIDLQNKEIHLEDIACHLYRGQIVCKNARFYFDDTLKPCFMYAPFLFDNVLLHFKKDMFTIFSGAICFEQRGNTLPTCKGHVILNRSQLKENIFSLAFQKELFHHAGKTMPAFDVFFDLLVETKEPIRVRTVLLDTDVHTKISIQNSLKNPHISGMMSVVSGSIALPSKPLFITKGEVSFLPGALHDPVIEFVAKNKIKKYNVIMSVTGSLQNPIILLDASPPLTQEQIVSLLLGGSEDSFGSALSTALIHNIKHIIFDTEHNPSKLHTAINTLFSPLRHIYLVPSFSDQTGRAGLRGAIEMDIGERWHALIQKNFNLSEDLWFEAEYAASDELTIRGFRDEHRDIGAEMEFRWKF